jgi:tetratricopeptide (TPR) repeat protein
VLDSALAEPRDAGFLRESCKRMAAAQLKRGQREDARETLARAASAFDRLVAAHPELHTAMGCSLVCARAAIQGASADHLAKQGDKGGAIAEYRGAIERLTEAHRIRPNEPELLDLLADLHSQLGFLVLGQRLNDQALAHFRESARMEVLLQETNPPGLSLHQHRLRIILRMESEAAAALGQVEAALAPVQQSIALDQRLLAANPKDTTARIDLSGDWARAADLFLALRRYSEANSAFDHVVLMQQGKDGASALNVEDGAKDDRLFCLAATKFCKGIWSAGSDSKVDTEQRRVLLGKVIEYARAFDMASLRLKKNGALSAELEKASREVAESVAGAQSALAR